MPVTSVNASMVEDHSDVAVAAGRARSADGFPVVAQPEARTDHGLELYLRGEAERQLEALDPLPPVLFYSVGVGAGQAHLLVPQRREVEATARGRHPHEGDLSAGPGEPHRVLHRPGRAHALEDPVRATHDDRLADLRSVRLRAEQVG